MYSICKAIIWVRDYGIGIAAPELSHIFERFHRAYNQNKSIHGLGIGLYIVKELITAHKGHVWVESTEGQGSTFYLQLPLYANTTS
jgi:signal transduction histidine kinase